MDSFLQNETIYLLKYELRKGYIPTMKLSLEVNKTEKISVYKRDLNLNYFDYFGLFLLFEFSRQKYVSYHKVIFGNYVRFEFSRQNVWYDVILW